MSARDPMIAGWRPTAVYALLFLLPVAGMSVRHWISASFGVLALLALPTLWRRPWSLTRTERVWVGIFLAFFAVFVLTSLANGWTELQTHHLGREIRFLAVIPIYLMVRRLPHAGLWLVRGSVAGGFAVAAQSLYDVYVLGLDRAQGIYSPTLLGPFAAFLGAFMLVLWRIDRALRPVLVASIVAAIGALALSVARGGYVGFIGMLLVWAGLRFRGRRLAVAAAGVAAVVLLAYAVSDHVRHGVDKATAEFVAAVEADGYAGQEGRLGSVPTRVEMWRVSLLIWRDNPILGVGRGNYTAAARQYVERGQVHFEVAEHGHPHNAYLEMLVSKGVLGLAAFLAMLLYPLYVFARGYRRSPETATLGMLLITGFALFSVTDASTLIKGNYIAIWLIYSAVFFAWHERRQAQRES